MSEEEKEDRLVLNTKKSLYDPIEIVIDNQTYKSKKVTRTVLDEVNKLDDQITEAPEDSELVYKAVMLLFDVDRKTLEKLDMREVQDIYLYSKKKFADIEKQRMELIAKTYGLMPKAKKKQAEETIPSRKRPGGKP